MGKLNQANEHVRLYDTIVQSLSDAAKNDTEMKETRNVLAEVLKAEGTPTGDWYPGSPTVGKTTV